MILAFLLHFASILVGVAIALPLSLWYVKGQRESQRESICKNDPSYCREPKETKKKKKK